MILCLLAGVVALRLMGSGAAETILDKPPGPSRTELSSPVVVPMVASQGRPVIEAMINGKGPFPLLLDTGASEPVLNPNLVDELKLPVTGARKIGDPAEPEGIAARALRVDQLTIGKAVFTGVTAVTWDGAGHFSPGARGVIGLALFRDLLLTIDYPKNEIRIERGELSAQDPGVVTYKPGPDGMVRVPVTVGSITVDADLDTGSPANVSVPKKYSDELALEAAPVLVGRARTVGGEFAIYGAKVKGEIRIGSVKLASQALDLHERLPVANIGYRALREFAITIDQKNLRVRFAK